MTNFLASLSDEADNNLEQPCPPDGDESTSPEDEAIPDGNGNEDTNKTGDAIEEKPSPEEDADSGQGDNVEDPDQTE